MGENFIEANNMLIYAQGLANNSETHDVEDKIRSAISATGLAAGFTGTAIDAISAITKEIGLTAKTFAKAGKIGVAGVVIGGIDVVVTVSDDEHAWNEADTLNLILQHSGLPQLFSHPQLLFLEDYL